MGNTGYFDLTDPETIQKWERELHVQVARRTPLMHKKYGFIGDSKNALFQKKKEVWASQGDTGTKATVTLARELMGEPTYGNQTLRGREETINTATFTWTINQVRHATKQEGRVSKRRVTWDIWDYSLESLGVWFAKIYEAAAMMHLAGVTVDVSTMQEWYHKGNKLGNTMCNAPRVPDTKHIMRIGHNSDTDDTNTGADNAATIDVDTLSELKARAKNLPVPIRPAMVNGRELYVFFAHSYALRHMKSNSHWMAVMKAAMQGGEVDNHPFWDGSLGIWDGVLVVENDYIPPGISASNTRVANARRNVFCGAQAGVLGIAKEFDKDNLFLFDEENWDYKNNRGAAATTLAGMACPYYSLAEQATVEDFAKIVCVSYAQELVTSA